MKLDIEDNSLRELLQKRKEYIGGSWVGSVGNIIAGISLALTVYSSGFPSNWGEYITLLTFGFLYSYRSSISVETNRESCLQLFKFI